MRLCGSSSTGYMRQANGYLSIFEMVSRRDGLGVCLVGFGILERENGTAYRHEFAGLGGKMRVDLDEAQEWFDFNVPLMPILLKSEWADMLESMDDFLTLAASKLMEAK